MSARSMMRGYGSIRSRGPSIVAAKRQGSIRVPVGRGLLTDGGEAGAVEKRLGQGTASQRLVEPGDGGSGERHRVARLGPGKMGQRFR